MKNADEQIRMKVVRMKNTDEQIRMKMARMKKTVERGRMETRFGWTCQLSPHPPTHHSHLNKSVATEVSGANVL